jgi:hypothetical protein
MKGVVALLLAVLAALPIAAPVRLAAADLPVPVQPLPPAAAPPASP